MYSRELNMKRRRKTYAVHKEDVYQFPEKEACPVVIMDYRVICHEINRSTKRTLERLGIDYPPRALYDSRFHQWVRNVWKVQIHRGIDMMAWTPMRVVAVSDKKPYWRTEVCEQLELAPYKGNRGGEVDYLLELIDMLGQEELQEAGVSYFKLQGFEADDWAGAAYRIKVHDSIMPDRVMFIRTIDGDWQQLVRDDHEILWANTGPASWGPRLRGELEVRAHCQKKLGQSLDHPQQMAAAKARVGDAGDNLFQGSPVELYDLVHRQQNDRYALETQGEIYERFREQLACAESNTDWRILETAKREILLAGGEISIRG